MEFYTGCEHKELDKWGFCNSCCYFVGSQDSWRSKVNWFLVATCFAIGSGCTLLGALVFLLVSHAW